MRDIIWYNVEWVERNRWHKRSDRMSSSLSRNARIHAQNADVLHLLFHRKARKHRRHDLGFLERLKRENVYYFNNKIVKTNLILFYIIILFNTINWFNYNHNFLRIILFSLLFLNLSFVFFFFAQHHWRDDFLSKSVINKQI